MAPQLQENHYSKDLTSRPLGAFKDESIEFFISVGAGIAFKIIHSSITGGQYCGCLEIFPQTDDIAASDYFVETVIPELESGTDDSSDIGEKLAEYGVDNFKTEPCARYVYSKTTLQHNDVTIVAAQIRGAFVEPGYQGLNISATTYQLLLRKFGCVMSDNKQTVDGASLWAIKFHGEGDELHVYDGGERVYLGILNDETVTTLGNIVWSADIELWSSFDAIENAEFTVTTDDCCHDIVLYKVSKPERCS